MTKDAIKKLIIEEIISGPGNEFSARVDGVAKEIEAQYVRDIAWVCVAAGLFVAMILTVCFW